MRVLTMWSLGATWRVMYNEGAYLDVLEGLLEGDVKWGLTLWSLRASWRVVYNEGAYLVVLESLLEGDVQWGCIP